MGHVVATTTYDPASPAGHGAIQALVEGLPDWEVRTAAWDDRGALRRALHRADALVIAGGPLFDVDPARGRSSPALARIARLTGPARRPVALVGVGASSVATGRAGRSARRIADRSSLLVVADDASAATLHRVGATPPFRIGADPTWTLLDRSPTRSRHHDVDVTVVLPIRQSALHRALAERLLLLDDATNVMTWTSDLSLVGLSDALASSRVAVVGEMHALVAAAAADVVSVAVGDDAGMAALADRLGQRCLPSSVDGPTLHEAIDAAKQTAAPSAAVKAEVARAEEGLRLLRIILSKGDSDDLDTLVGLPLGPVSWAW